MILLNEKEIETVKDQFFNSSKSLEDIAKFHGISIADIFSLI